MIGNKGAFLEEIKGESGLERKEERACDGGWRVRKMQFEV